MVHLADLRFFLYFRFILSILLDNIGFTKKKMSKMKKVSTDVSGQDREPFVEVDPSERFGRYPELLGSGAMKNVYRGFDIEEGRDVAWNQIKLKKLDEYAKKRLFSEIKLLKTLKNENLIVLYGFWRDSENNHLNFITEACVSGNLRDYRKKHKRVSLKVLKKWSRQILKGLDYLHTHEPCVIHRDLNCSNIFINGNTGKVNMLSDFKFRVYLCILLYVICLV